MLTRMTRTYHATLLNLRLPVPLAADVGLLRMAGLVVDAHENLGNDAGQSVCSPPSINSDDSRNQPPRSRMVGVPVTTE